MSVSSDVLRRLGALRLAPEAMEEILSIMADVLAASEAIEAVAVAKRAKDAERKRTARSSEESPRTNVGQSEESPADPLSPEQKAPTPLKTQPLTPVPPSPPKGGSSPAESEPDDVSAAFESYNLTAKDAGWPLALTLNSTRRAGLAARLVECGGIDGWRNAMARARASPFLTGDNDRNWMASLDFFLQRKSFTKLIEGAFDVRRPDRTGRPTTYDRSGPDALMAALADVASEELGRRFPERRNPGPDFADGPILDLRPNGSP